MKYHFIYKTINLVNNKYYYGKHSTNDISDNYLGSGKLLKKALTKYGRNNFTRTILCYCDTEVDAYELEELVITDIEINDAMCYNLDLGGIGCMSGRHHSKETKKLISTNNAKHYFGKTFSREHKIKLSNAHKGRTGALSSKYGTSCSDETKRKMSDIKSGIKHPRCKKIAQLNKDTLEIIKIYDYIKLAEQDGFNPGHICSCCKGTLKSHKKFKWKYLN